MLLGHSIAVQCLTVEVFPLSMGAGFPLLLTTFLPDAKQFALFSWSFSRPQKPCSPFSWSDVSMRISFFWCIRWTSQISSILSPSLWMYYFLFNTTICQICAYQQKAIRLLDYTLRMITGFYVLFLNPFRHLDWPYVNFSYSSF